MRMGSLARGRDLGGARRRNGGGGGQLSSLSAAPRARLPRGARREAVRLEGRHDHVERGLVEERARVASVAQTQGGAAIARDARDGRKIVELVPLELREGEG